MTKVLISAFIGSKNLGDEAIFKSILDNLGVDRNNITALSINEEKTQKIGVKTLFAKNIINIVRGIRSCDVFLIGGGGIIQDQSSVLNFLYYAFQVWVAKVFRKKTILCFVGVGPINYGISKFLLRRLFNHIDTAVVRDEKSKKVLGSYIKDQSKIHVYHDPVLNYVFNPSKLPENPYRNKGDYVVVSLRRWFFTLPLLPVFMTRNLNKLRFFRKDYDKFMDKISKDLDAFLDDNKNIKLVLTSFYDSEDLAVLADLKVKMKNQSRVIPSRKNISEDQYLSIVKGSKFIIGMRLHSLILGSTVSKPFVALRYSAKVDEFTEQMGLTDYSIHVEEYNSDKLVGSMNNMLLDSSKLEAGMQAKLSEYQKDNRKAFDLLKKIIN